MAKLTVDELFDETMRLSDILELADRLVWIWRITSYKVRCEDGTCHVSEENLDPTELILNFRDALLKGQNRGFFNAFPEEIQLAELLAIQTMKRSANMELRPPEHLWQAAEDTNANCSCGWNWPAGDVETAFGIWEEHAGEGLELLPWQEEWLNEFNVQP